MPPGPPCSPEECNALRFTGAAHKGEGIGEVPKSVGAFDPPRLVRGAFRCAGITP